MSAETRHALALLAMSPDTLDALAEISAMHDVDLLDLDDADDLHVPHEIEDEVTVPLNRWTRTSTVSM
jgi:hypothetical protein